ncbi:receptor-like protein kinase [Trifolium pratense]|nr:receptor-like protein kinase [Trifolium pratense]
MTKTSCSSRIIKLLLFIISFLHVGFALSSDGLTLLSLLTHWTSVPTLISSSWKASDSNPCSWVGVQCDHTNNLISLNLTSHGIFGQLGSEIGNLYNLQTLVLSGNGFSGKVPLELSNCSLIQYLDLEGNRFSGNIQYSFINLQNLQFMRLSSNMLTGEIPDSLFEIPSLKELSLHSNLLSGPIPTSIGNLTQLLRLYLYGNQLSGTIPSSIGNCSKLEDLELSFNRLRGEIPNSIWRIPSLVNILVHNNSLSGELPTEMTNLKYLKNISLFDNQFSGVIPQSLGINSSIVKLDCMNNKFTGNIPPSLCFGKNLLELNMGINQLQDGIPSDVGRCATLRRLILNENNFSGPLPNFESNMNLKYIDLTKNNISGTIPSSLGNSTNLTYINFSRNKFAGLIPPELGNLVNLVVLDLSHNNLEGPLPIQLSNCTKIDRFDVGFNFLNGSFPSSLRSWTNITTLILRENHFTGGIPGFLAEFNNLRELQLGGNFFGGKIPQLMGTMHNLFYGLNLSANGLIGDIPSEIGKLELLQSLDISLNNLTGSIDALEGLVSLIEINISYNLFNGSVPTGLTKLLNSSPSSFIGNPLLCFSCLSCIETSFVNPCVYKSSNHKSISTVQIVMIELGSSIFITVVILIIIRIYFLKMSCSPLVMVLKAMAKLYDCYNFGRGIVHKSQQGRESEMASDLKQQSDIERGATLRQQSYNERGAAPASEFSKWSYYIEKGVGRIGVTYAREFNISGKEKLRTLKDVVLEATENLNQRYIIGKGGHGTVYKAIIGQQIFAVKKVEFGRNKKKRLSIIRNEIEVLGMFKHRNLLKHADYWIGEEYGLVLCEFMKNGSLHDILHEKKPPPPLTWNVRCKIAVGIAQGLLYLHYDCVPRIVHRDIKPKNILVDDNMEPIIADFGTALCKKVFEDSNSHSTIRKMLSSHVVGTPGYIAPENAYDIVPGRKSDVYSYGVVLLELLTRKKLLVPSLNDEAEDTPLVIWARSVWMETGKIEKIVDPYLASEFSSSVAIAKQVAAVLSLAFRCIEKDPGKRPNMKGVISIYNKNLFKLRRDEVQYADVLAIKLMGNGKLQADKFVRIASLIVPKITYSSRSLIFLSSITGPILTKPFNWFFLLRWGQYRHLQKSLYSQTKSYYSITINTDQTEATVQISV